MRWNLTYNENESVFSARAFLRDELIPTVDETTYDYLEAISSLQKLFDVPLSEDD